MNRVLTAEWRFGRDEEKGLAQFLLALKCITRFDLDKVAGNRERVKRQLMVAINVPRRTIRGHPKDSFYTATGPDTDEMHYSGFHGTLSYRLNDRETKAEHCVIVYNASRTSCLQRLVAILGSPERLVRELSGPQLALDLKRYPPDWLSHMTPPMVE